MVKEFIANNDDVLIKRLTSVLTTEFSVSHNPHSRKGGLIGLAATAIALGKVTIIFAADFQVYTKDGHILADYTNSLYPLNVFLRCPQLTPHILVPLSGQ